MRIPIFILFSVLMMKCKTIPAPAAAEPKVYLRLITQFNDSGRMIGRRYVFSHIPCSAIQLTDEKGKSIPQVDPEKKVEIKDSACYTCTEFTNINSVFMDWVQYKGNNYSYNIYSKGLLMVDGPYCSQAPINVWSKWNDSLHNVVFWITVEETKGILNVYMADESYSAPFYKTERIDSIRFDLNHFCGDEEAQEEIKAMQELYEKHVEVYVNPNPYIERFELRATVNKLPPWLTPTEQVQISFFDENGNTVLSRPFKFDETYNFEFPDIKSGKLLYYKIHWLAYSITGQILKA